MKIKKVCSYCGSENILFDAYAKWDVEKQEYVHDDVLYGNVFCEECKGECSVREIKIEE